MPLSNIALPFFLVPTALFLLKKIPSCLCLFIRNVSGVNSSHWWRRTQVILRCPILIFFIIGFSSSLFCESKGGYLQLIIGDEKGKSSTKIYRESKPPHAKKNQQIFVRRNDLQRRRKDLWVWNSWGRHLLHWRTLFSLGDG